MARAVASSIAAATVAIVPATAGKVKVTSAVDAGPISFTELVPLLESSKKDTNPAVVLPFFTDKPVSAIGIPVKVATPSTCNVDAISTAPSISTTSKLEVPATSIAPLISKVAASNSPVMVRLRIPV